MDLFVPPALGRYCKTVSGGFTSTIGDSGVTFSGTGTWSLLLDTYANLGSSWMIGVFNAGVGTITIDAQGQNILSSKGTATTEAVGPGKGVVLGCNGSTFYVLVTNYDETGAATWGNILGTLSNQTDLNNALGAKAATATTVTGTGNLAGGGDLTVNRTLDMASMAATTVKGNKTGSPAVPTDLTAADLRTLLLTPIVPYTSDQALTAAQTGACFTNAGAAGTVNLTLPTAAVGLAYAFLIDVAQQLNIKPGSSDYIRTGSSTTLVGGSGGKVYGSTIGNALTLICHKANYWTVISTVGTWNVT